MTVTPLKPEPRRQGITMTYADCNNRVLHNALEKLDNHTGFSAADLSRFNKIKHYYDSQSKTVSHLFKKLIAKHAVHEQATRKDKDGKVVKIVSANGKPQMTPVMVPNRQGRMDFVFKDRAAFDKDYRELMAQTFSIEATLLMTEDVVKAGLTPKEVRVCGKILSDFDPSLIDETPVSDEDEDEAVDPVEDGPPEAENHDADASERQGATLDATGSHGPSASL